MSINPDNPVVSWLLEGDVAIQYQVWRDLFGQDRPGLRRRIGTEGWGAAILSKRHQDGTWGEGFYQPKWTSSHYTLLDLKNLALDPGHKLAGESVDLISHTEKREDGGIGPGETISASDACVNGMFLNYASYFGAAQSELESIVDFLIAQHMADGGFNCRLNRSGARHSSLHSTISVLEGITEYERRGYDYRVDELSRIARRCVGFILVHRLFRSDRTGEVIKPEFLKLPYPWRWKYNILRALDCFAAAGVAWDARMQDGIEALMARCRPDGRWPTNAAHPGTVHVVMDPARQPGRWNTLMALRVLSRYGKHAEG